MRRLLILLSVISMAITSFAEITIEQLNQAQLDYQSAFDNYHSISSINKSKIESVEAELVISKSQLESQQAELIEMKPKSPKAKKMTKQIETTEEQIELLQSKINKLQEEIDRSAQELASKEQIYNQIREQFQQQSQESASEQEQINAPSDEDSNSSSEPTITNDSKSDAPTVNTANSEEEESWIIANIFWIIVVIVLLVWFRKRHRCPHCGHWFCMESQGDVHVWDHDPKGNIIRRGFRKRRVCKRCGESSSIIEWNN